MPQSVRVTVMSQKSPSNGKLVRPKRPPAAILNEIKRVWQPGMTAKQIAEAVDPLILAQKTSVIQGYFSRWKNELAPCHLPGQRKGNGALAIPIPEPEPEPEPVPVVVTEKPLYGETYVDHRGVRLPKVFRD
jgi:hypothetical protein